MRPAVIAALLFALPLSLSAQSTPTPKPSFATPAYSPDGTEIAFASGGDIWTVSSNGGAAHLLISDPAEESRPLYSPDGARLAFQSTRSGANDIYLLTFATGTLQRITYSDAPITLDAWSRDGEWLYFTSSANDVAGQNDIFRVRATGGTPLEVSAERYLQEFESTPSPDGRSIVLVAKGISAAQWWRKGHAHIDETELWLKVLDQPNFYSLLLPADSKHAWPMAAPNGKTLYFMSDKSGAENIWQVDISSAMHRPATDFSSGIWATDKSEPTPTQITHFTNGRVLWPTLSYDGKSIVFERNFAIWKLDIASGKSSELAITLRGVPATPGVTHTPITSWSNLALSPDGQKIAVAAHGDIFAAPAKDGGEPQRLTFTDAAESDPQWSPDSTKLVYLSERDGGQSLYLYDFTSGKETPLTASKAIDASPTFSPDSRSLAYLRNRKELHILTFPDAEKPEGAKANDAPRLPDLTAKPTDKIIATGEIDAYSSGSIAFSPDSHWVVYAAEGIDEFSNLNAVPADGSAPSQPITFLANGETASRIAWSPDGKYILFDTNQRAETTKLARVDLVPHVPTYREDQFRDLFRKQTTPGAPDTPTESKPETKPEPSTEPGAPAPAPDSRARAGSEQASKSTAKKKPEPTRIVFEGIRDRLTLLPIDLDLRSPLISPDGKTLAFIAEDAGQQNIYTYSLDELSREPATPRQLTYTAGFKTDLAFTPSSKELFYLEGGRGDGAGVRSISLEARTPKPVPLTASIDVDFDHEKMVVFDEAWTTLDHRFWNPTFNGIDWPALHEQWRPYIAGARTGPELRRDINLLIGELNSSHSGISKPAPPAVRTGRLGLRYERAPFEKDGSLIIREIVPLGPAALAIDDKGAPLEIHLGDKLLAVDGKPITPSTNLDALLEDRSGKRTVLSLESKEGGKKYEAVVRPVSLQTESGLLYRAWVDSRRAYVEKISGGKLGYVHIAAMGDADLAQLYLDLDVQNQSKQGVVIDVRNNNGGYVNGRVIDVFSRRNYLTMTPRDGSTAPSRQALGQRALGLPTVLVTNESTLSDGEDFTEGYRTLQLGKTVGTPTAGWIIFTGSARLIDGSAVRVPGDRIRDTRGQDMEMHPRPVDIEQLRPLGETETGEDAQLKKAVETLLAQLK